MRSKVQLVLAAVLFLIEIAPLSEAKTDRQSENGALQPLTFMCGDWAESGIPGEYVEEYWSEPYGDGMVGHYREVENGKTKFYELLSIVAEPDGIVLRMRHFDRKFVPWTEAKEPGDCYLVSNKAGEAVFDNKSENNRVRVKYSKTGSDKLLAAVEVTKEGKTSRFQFEYSRRRTIENAH